MLLASLVKVSVRRHINQILPSTANLSGFRCASQASVGFESFTQTRSKTFNEIPGPPSVPILGTVANMMWEKPRDVPVGKYFLQRQLDDVQRYGKIFKGHIPAYGKMAFIADADAASAILRMEPKYPRRIDMPLMDHYRETRNTIPGVFFADGSDWYKYRSVISRKILKPRKVAKYSEPFNEISKSFLDRVSRIRGVVGSGYENEVRELDQELFKWSFESVAYLLFDKRFGTLADQVNPEAQAFINSVGGFLQAVLPAGFLPVWFYKLYETKPYKAFVSNFDSMYQYADLFINRKVEELNNQGKLNGEAEDGEEVDFFHFLLSSGKQTKEDLMASVIDLLFAGVDTTSNTMQWVLYLLGTHPEKQEKLYREISSVLKPWESPTSHTIAKLPYLRAWLKETLRLYPVLSALPRVLPHDIDVLGYNIPAGTNINILYYHMGRDNDLFEDADQFKPERWLRDEEHQMKENIHAFASLPFGFGTRMCVGRRIAELELNLLTIKTLQRHVIKYPHSDPVEPFMRGTVIPDRPVGVRFLDRHGF